MEAEAPTINAEWNGWNGLNDAGIEITGADAFWILWGDGQRERVTRNADRNGDGFAETAYAFHSFGNGADGVYKITITDAPNRPETPNLQLRAYLSANDDDGTVVRASNLNDAIVTGDGDDRIFGLGGNDQIIAGAGNDTVFGGEGDNIVVGDAGDDRLYGGSGGGLIGGGDGADTIYGEAGFESIYGDAGDDVIYSGAVGLSGGSHGGYLNGGAGRDLLVGHAGGFDSFEFSAAQDTGLGPLADTIRGFLQGEDRINISEIFQDGFGFIGTARFSGGRDGAEVRYVQGANTTVVYGDVDGDGRQDFQINLQGVYALTGEDFGIFNI
jgi:Ca2+-binding RTX toxin-like protein